MLLIDRNEPEQIDSYLNPPLDITRGSFNQTGGTTVIYPDYTIVGSEKMIGISRKQVGEVLSSIDRCEEQLQRELTGPCEHLALIIEGVMRSDGNGGAWAYSFDWDSEHYFNTARQVGSVGFKRQHFNQNFEGVQNWQTRLEWLGVQVIHTYSLQDTAGKIVAMHNLAFKGSESKTLSRLIKEKHTVIGVTPQETAFARTLMGIEGAGFGEALALTVATSFDSIKELFDYWDGQGLLSDMMLRGGTRRVGTSAEQKLQKALGYESSSSLRV